MKTALADLTAFGERRLKAGAPLDIVNAPEGFDAFVLATLAKALARSGENRAAALGFVARDEARAKAFAESLAFADRDIGDPQFSRLGLPTLRPRFAERRRRRRAHDGAGAPRPDPRFDGTAPHCRAHRQRAAAARAAAGDDRRRSVVDRAGPCREDRAIDALAGVPRFFARQRRSRRRRLCRARRHSRPLRADPAACRCGSISSATRSRPSARSIPKRSARSRRCRIST